MGLFLCLLLATADLTRVAGIEIVAPEDSVRFSQAWFICRILSGSYLELPCSLCFVDLKSAYCCVPQWGVLGK